MDAPTCSLARGSPVLGMGLCYDVYNHMLWSVTADWVDQFYNPGHPASHHTLDRYDVKLTLRLQQSAIRWKLYKGWVYDVGKPIDQLYHFIRKIEY